MEELKGALLRQQPDASLADEVKQLRAEVKRKLDIIHGLTAEKNMYTSELATMRVTQEVRKNDNTNIIKRWYTNHIFLTKNYNDI